MSEVIKLTNEYLKTKDTSLIPKIAKAKAEASAKKRREKVKIVKAKKVVEKKTFNADVNGDGVVDEKDLSIVSKEMKKKKKGKKQSKKVKKD